MASVIDTLFLDLVARDKASKELLKVTATIGAVGFAIGKFAKSSIEAYKDAEASQSKLEQAYKKFPKTADKSIDSMREINKQLQKTTKYDDDATAAAEAHLAQYDLTGQQIAALIPLVQDYATATGKDLESATKDVGKAIIGQGKALKNVGIDFKNTGTKAGNLTELQTKLNEKVGGFATNEGKTAAGQAEILKNQYGDLQETVGAALVPALNGLVDMGTKVLGVFNDLPDPVKQVTIMVGLLGGAALVAAPKVLALKELLGVGTGVGKAAAEGATGLSKFSGFIGKAGPWGLAIAGAIGLIAAFTAGTDDSVTAVEDSTKALGENRTAYLDDIKAKQLSEFATADNLKLLKDSGITLGLVGRAINGNKDAQKLLNAEIDKANEKNVFQVTTGGRVYTTLNNTGQALEDLKHQLELNNHQVDLSAGYWDDLNAAAGRAGDTLSHTLALSAARTGATGKQGQRTSGRVEGRAVGGPVKAGQPYLVGENGPELYTPKHDGRITPNGQTSGSGVGGTTVIENHLYLDGVELINTIRKRVRGMGGDVQSVLGS